MTDAAIDHLIACQSDLIAALDAGDVGAIEVATAQLANAAKQAQRKDSWHSKSDSRSKIEHGLKQTVAARTRINYLSEWTRQKIDRLNEVRGIANPHVYANIRNSLNT